MDPEGLVESKESLEIKDFDRVSHASERIELGLYKDMEFSTLFDEGSKVEASNSTSTQLSIQTSSRFDDVSSEEPTNAKCLEAFDVQHSTLTDPNFVENYFKNSRLHFIGTWRNRYRRRFCNLLQGNCSKGNVGSCSSKNKASIIHIDMDCFFVSVILRKYPELLDNPVAVCHSDNSKGTAEISSANYPARGYGIRAGMFVKDAKICCPNLVVLPYDFGAYEEVADQFYSILHKHCNKVQALSCDEAFLDITECDDLDPENFALMIRKEIVETTQCSASAGIAGNLLLARLATKIAKPNGQCSIPFEKVENFLDDLPVTMLPGIGHALGDKLETRKIHSCGQLRLVSKEALHKDFGVKVGDMLWNYCRGIDDQKVEVLKEPKSICAEVNWGVRFRNTMDCELFLNNLSIEVSSRLRECGVVARTINLKVKKRRKGAKEPVKFMGCGDCENMSRSMTLPVATDDATLIQRISKKIFVSYHIDAKEVRGVGLQMSKLETADVNSQGCKLNVIESWLSIPGKVGKETIRLDSPSIAAASLSSSEEHQPDLQRHGEIHENSQLCLDRAAACSNTLHVNLFKSRSYKNATSELPSVCHLDVSVIKDLPAEIISELDIAYNGRLYDLIKKHDEGQKNNRNLLIRPLEEVLGGTNLKPERSYTSCENSKMAEASEMMLRQVELPAVLCSNLNILQTKSTTCANPMDLASGFSSKAVSITQNISVGASLDKSALSLGVPSHSASLSGACDTLKKFPNHIGSEGSQETKNDLWSGSPPKWVEKFKVSNCLILNLIAQLYNKFGAGDLFSPILQSLISLCPLILGSSSDEPVEARFDLCELLLQYIDHKIDSDIEELYLCYRLLQRLNTLSDFFSEVYNTFLSPLQVSVSENYGGTLQLTETGD